MPKAAYRIRADNFLDSIFGLNIRIEWPLETGLCLFFDNLNSKTQNLLSYIYILQYYDRSRYIQLYESSLARIPHRGGSVVLPETKNFNWFWCFDLRSILTGRYMLKRRKTKKKTNEIEAQWEPCQDVLITKLFQ